MPRVRQEDSEMHGFVDGAEEFPERAEHDAELRPQHFPSGMFPHPIQEIT